MFFILCLNCFLCKNPLQFVATEVYVLLSAPNMRNRQQAVSVKLAGSQSEPLCKMARIGRQPVRTTVQNSKNWAAASQNHCAK